MLTASCAGSVLGKPSAANKPSMASRLYPMRLETSDELDGMSRYGSVFIAKSEYSERKARRQPCRITERYVVEK